MICIISSVFYYLFAVTSVVALSNNFRAGQLRMEIDETSRQKLIASGVEETNTTNQMSPETTFRCVGAVGNRSCLFRNLYFSRGRFVMYVTKMPKEEDILLYRADKYEYPWHAEIRTFSNVRAITDHLAGKDIIEEKGLSVQFNPLFHQNIGHALFDGLYPAFLATVKLGLESKPWRPVVAVDPGCFVGPGIGGELKTGEIVEAYFPDPKYNRTLRTIRAKVTVAPASQLAEEHCQWRLDLDHNGLDLGSIPGTTQTSCMQGCSQSFSCKAAVLYGGICYLKGQGGFEFSSPARELCVLNKSSKPKPKMSVMPEQGQGIKLKDVEIPQEWVVDRVRQRCMSEGVFETFGGVGEIRRLFELERDSRNHANLVIRFEEMVMGVGGAGNLIADKSGAIGGSIAPQGAMKQFRDRMLSSYGLNEESTKSLPVDRYINVIVVQNKRFHPEDHSALGDVIRRLNNKGGVHAEFIDWAQIGNSEDKFKEQLRRIQEADVYISSIGTALQYVPFLRDGRVYIALGSVWMRSGRYFPTFMEQQLAGGGTPYLRTLYADPGAVLRRQMLSVKLPEDGYYVGVDANLLVEIVQKAENLVRTGFPMPVPAEDNLSAEAKLLVELCRRDTAACNEINEYRNGREYECECLLWNEAVVYEVGPWREGGKCGNSYRKLLRQLRKEYRLPGYGAPDS